MQSTKEPIPTLFRNPVTELPAARLAENDRFNAVLRRYVPEPERIKHVSARCANAGNTAATS